MARAFDAIPDHLVGWLEAQPLFFVATAPAGEDGHVNVSPKGYDTFRVLGPNEVAYLDLTGSGAETIAHLRDNGRLTLMFCSFDEKPNIVRLYGRGRTVPARRARLRRPAPAVPRTGRHPRRHRARRGPRRRVVRVRRPPDGALRRAFDLRRLGRTQGLRRPRRLPGREERRKHRRPPRPRRLNPPTGSGRTARMGRVQRVSVVGVSGSGKSTFATTLAERLAVPHLELDSVYHPAGGRPTWSPTSSRPRSHRRSPSRRG